MTIIRYVDIFKTEETPEGLVDSVSVRDATLPIVIDPEKIITIQPYFNGKGTIFKNVSYINYDGDIMKVVGNYKTLENKILSNTQTTRIKVKGYIRYNG